MRGGGRKMFDDQLGGGSEINNPLSRGVGPCFIRHMGERSQNSSISLQKKHASFRRASHFKPPTTP